MRQFQSYFSQQSRNSVQRKQSQHRKMKFSLKDYIPIEENTQIWMIILLETTRAQLQNRDASPTAVTKIQILLFSRRNNPETFREERLVSKKRCMIKNIANPWYILQQKQCHLYRSHRGGTTETSTRRMAPTDSKRFWHGFHHQL